MSKRAVIVFVARVIAFFSLTSLSSTTFAQVSDVDSLGNIWIITVDKSGSMLWNSNKQYQLDIRFLVAQSVASRISHIPALKNVNFDTDRFIFFNSGILRDNDIADLKYQNRFDSSFIHHTDGHIYSFKNVEQLINQIRQQLEAADYKYYYSFVSLIRIFSLSKGIEFIKNKELTRNFNRVLLITITDDADQNDQWMNDYRTVKKYVPERLKEVNQTIEKYLYNPLNSKSNVDKTGVLNELYIDEKVIPHINCYEYVTTQSMGSHINTSTLLAPYPLKDNHIGLKLNYLHYDGNPILFARVDTLVVDGSSDHPQQLITDSTSIVAAINDQFSSNSISVNGSFQILYTDSVLGERYKKYSFNQHISLPSPKMTSLKKWLKVGSAILIGLLLIYIFLFRPRTRLFSLYDNKGNRFSLQRGNKLFSKWKPGENALVSYALSKTRDYSFIAKKHRNIARKQIPIGSSIPKIILTSRKELQIDNQDNVMIEEFRISTDIDIYHKGREYDPLLKKLVHAGFPHRVDKAMTGLKLSNTWLGKKLSGVVRSIAGKNYYCISLKEADFTKNSIISISSSKVTDLAFSISFILDNAGNNSTVINNRNISCLNEFYADTKLKADAIIAVHISENSLSWNILKLEHQNSLSQIHHVLNYNQKFKSGENSNIDAYNKDISLIVAILKKDIVSNMPEVKNCVVYVTSPDESFDLPGFRVIHPGKSDQGNVNKFVLRKSLYTGFLYLVEARDIENRKTTQIYSPIINGLRNDIMTRSPAKGEYHLYKSVIPFDSKSEFNGFAEKISDNLFQFTTVRDIQLRIDINDNTVIYSNHITRLN